MDSALAGKEILARHIRENQWCCISGALREVDVAFKDKLQALIEERGGRAQENFYHIAELAREIQPDFTPAYLSRLLLGHPARPEDYQALAAALRVLPADLVDSPDTTEAENLRKVHKFLSERMKRPDLYEPFVEHLVTSAEFRVQNLETDDLYIQFNDFIELWHSERDELT